jgi:hypothetical protein
MSESREIERWRPVADFEGLYEVSNLGNVRSFHSGAPAILKPFLRSTGYPAVELWNGPLRKRRQVSALVLEAFIGPRPARPTRHDAAHINGDPFDNRLENLVWVTHRENMRHRIPHGTNNPGEKNPMTRLTNDSVVRMRGMFSRKEQEVADLAKTFGLATRSVYYILRGWRWKYAGGPIVESTRRTDSDPPASNPKRKGVIPLRLPGL